LIKLILFCVIIIWFWVASCWWMFIFADDSINILNIFTWIITATVWLLLLYIWFKSI
jgi:hypothetical protein